MSFPRSGRTRMVAFRCPSSSSMLSGTVLDFKLLDYSPSEFLHSRRSFTGVVHSSAPSAPEIWKKWSAPRHRTAGGQASRVNRSFLKSTAVWQLNNRTKWTGSPCSLGGKQGCPTHPIYICHRLSSRMLRNHRNHLRQHDGGDQPGDGDRGGHDGPGAERFALSHAA